MDSEKFENKRFVIAAWIFAGCMLLAVIAIPLYLAPARQPGPAASGARSVADDPRISGLVSTRTLSDSEIAELRRHPDRPTPVQQPHYDNEVIVTAVIQNEIHLVAATPTPQDGSDNQVIETDTRDAQPLAQPPTQLPAPSESQHLSPVPTPISPVQTPISPLPTPEPPTPQDAGDVQAFVQTIVDAQNVYYTANGRYAQVIFGDSPQCPVPGSCINLSYPEGVTVAVNVYTSPAGDGYEVVIIHDGWRITVNHGPESQRSTGWRRVNEP